MRRLGAVAGQDRRQRRLIPLLRVLGLLLDGLGAAPEAGIEAPGPTLTFDMSKLFEALLASRLRRVLPGCGVDEQTSHRFGQDGRFLLQPDLLVSRHGKPSLVIDAKWKRIAGHSDVVDADLRQAFAYARIPGIQQAALV